MRSLAFELIQRPGWSGRGVGLLRENFEPGDWQLVEGLANRNLSPDAYHTLGFDILDIVKSHPDPEAAGALLALYERNPCSMCRARAVQALHSLDQLPAHIFEECQYDSNFDLREDTQRSFAPDGE